ncbi:MAG: glycosyl transferase family 1 [bacterium (Candidatus Ratteibacteria) CG01_land_8_20_14_3_00_40_19]|uniref:Glycosyl transferase family 1 n=1 Tax=bacterium (Candidatus Ratteibacteria) CG01_land_8_20_14_3_00_40_19 TaxID=2014290 RepID=A0A2M7E799_9BACT|nr:MAG: glycosyl transferase family 1 [bacterium (Candidatus Ratteibacteria) CG01_land_8_20_14_3_00_40_19]
MKSKIILVSSYPPRQCGIAAFTADLVNSLGRIDSELNCRIVAIGDKKYHYDKKVKFCISQRKKESFLKAADWINDSKANIINIQHQFLLYGEEGEFTASFLNRIKLPVITTIHTLPSQPARREKEAIKAIVDKSEKVTVMINYAKEILRKVYHASGEKIKVIPHPVPKIEKIGRERAKLKLGLKGNIISTFGFIRRDKGIEYGLAALPEILKQTPDTFYLIIGKTQPSHRAEEGESYRKSLINRAEKLGVRKNVKLVNRFLPLKELTDYLYATDIFLTPYLGKSQVSSGALIYGLSLGRICISTPFSYAKEVLSSGRGILVEFRKSGCIAKAVTKILRDGKLRKDMEKKAYQYGKNLLWDKVAKDYLKLFRRNAK